ncbi:methyl-accepting chemotaxis protein [Halomonas sp. C22]|uniref:methyl-accepting chemotaxis protein n=1 Tax=Halomonas sp. C22 TaxID=2580567 RepID=UPI0011A13972|nr:methyl-accepting chemotaxis protein [Halomonas sp. C22]
MKNIRIQHSLTASMVLLTILILLVGAFAITAARKNVRNMSELNELTAKQVNASNRMDVNLMELRLRMARYTDLARDNHPDMSQAQSLMRESLERTTQRFEELNGYNVTEQQQRYPYYMEVIQRYNEMITPTLRQAVAAGNVSLIESESRRMDSAATAFTLATREFSRFANTIADEMQSEAKATNQHIVWTVAGVLFASLILLVTLQVVLRRYIVSPLGQAVEICDHIAQGDLTRPINDQGSNEIGKLYQAMAAMQTRLTEMMLTLSQTSQMVAQNARDIASGSEDLASRTEEQASALQETAASMEQMSSTVSQNNQTSSTASELTVTASAKASAARQEVEQTTALMKDMERHSQRVQDIIQVIEGIAFQTSILALNASVEAARAGAHGRGFAVVAGEVRKLATKTSESSAQIRTIIDDIAARIKEGARQSERSAEGMASTVTAVKQVNELMQEIALAVNEQESGISQVSTAITQMDSATQQNVSLVSETSTAAASLQDEANRLAELIATFKINGQQKSASFTAKPATVLNTLPAKLQAGLRNATARQPLEPEWSEF